jgi:hypothetical protein
MSWPRLHTYRLTEADEATVLAALNEKVADWSNRRSGPFDRATAMVALTRIGAHAIGCSLHDLRDVEIDWVERHASRTATLIAEARTTAASCPTA